MRKDGKYEVEVNGFDYFDTAKGELVAGGNDAWAGAVNAKGGFGVWCSDVAYEVAALQDVLGRHAGTSVTHAVVAVTD